MAAPLLLPPSPLFDRASLNVIYQDLQAIRFDQPLSVVHSTKKPAKPADTLVNGCRQLGVWLQQAAPRRAAHFHQKLDYWWQALQNLLKALYVSPKALGKIRKGVMMLINAIALDCRNVFIVHGRDDNWRVEVQNLLSSQRIPSVVLAREANQGQVILQKFEQYARQCQYAIILCSPDDLGALRPGPRKLPGLADLQARARQNVVLEMGYFLAHVGAKNLFVLHPPKGGLEAPSDLAGVVHEVFDAPGQWRKRLLQELQAAKFPIPDSVYKHL